MVQCHAYGCIEPFVKLLRAQSYDDKGRWNLGSMRGGTQLSMEAPIGKTTSKWQHIKPPPVSRQEIAFEGLLFGIYMMQKHRRRVLI